MFIRSYVYIVICVCMDGGGYFGMGKKEIIKGLTNFKSKLKGHLNIDSFIFFGSRASGKPKKDSDIDLIIVSKNFEGTKFRYRAMGLYDYWDLDYAVDFLCYTPKEFAKLKDNVSIVREAVESGVEIK